MSVDDESGKESGKESGNNAIVAAFLKHLLKNEDNEGFVDNSDTPDIDQASNQEVSDKPEDTKHTDFDDLPDLPDLLTDLAVPSALDDSLPSLKDIWYQQLSMALFKDIREDIDLGKIRAGCIIFIKDIDIIDSECFKCLVGKLSYKVIKTTCKQLDLMSTVSKVLLEGYVLFFLPGKKSWIPADIKQMELLKYKEITLDNIFPVIQSTLSELRKQGINTRYGQKNLEEWMQDLADKYIPIKYSSYVLAWFQLLEENGWVINERLSDHFLAFLKMAKTFKLETGNQVKILDWIGDSEKSEVKNYLSLLQPMNLAGNNDPDVIYRSLQSEFPWMQEANQALAEAAAICHRIGLDYFRISKPIMLVGKPGIGKTRWAKRAASILGLKLGSLSLAGVNNSLSVIGTERGWSTAHPSFPARMIHKFNTANPLLFVDEIDKAGESNHNGNPVDALLTMLEQESSTVYPDNFLQGNLNISFCSWIFAVNSIAGLSQPLLSRVRIVKPTTPGLQHFNLIFQGIIEDFCESNKISKDQLPDVQQRSSVFEQKFSENLNIRLLKTAVEDWINSQFWQPPGPRLIVNQKEESYE